MVKLQTCTFPEAPVENQTQNHNDQNQIHNHNDSDIPQGAELTIGREWAKLDLEGVWLPGKDACENYQCGIRTAVFQGLLSMGRAILPVHST